MQKGLAAVASAAALALIGWFVNWGMPKLVDWIDGVREPPVASRLFIVDTSRSMTGSLGRRAKFEAVKREIGRYVRNQPDVAFALRTAGGGCDVGGYHEPPVEFHSGNGDDVRKALGAVTLGGGADVVTAIEQGSDDFQRFGVAKSAKIQTIWLFLGTARDQCKPTHPSLGAGIKRALTDSPASISYVDFFVLRGDRRSVASLRKSVEALGATFTVQRVATPAGLRRSVRDAAFRERASP